MSKPQVATVIVTFNRINDLKKCLDAVEQQSLSPAHIYVIDNASTDGTSEWLADRKFSLPTTVITMKENTGGAGGFSKGIQTAHETGLYDGYWVMDDDGMPAPDCLEKLMEHFGESEYIAPIVLDRDDHTMLAFGNKPLKEFMESIDNKPVASFAFPFNGIFYSKVLVDKVGYPKSEMFIWGDEHDYGYRMKPFGFKAFGVVDAVHYHPKDSVKFDKDIRGRYTVFNSSSKLRTYCHHRNYTYLAYKYGSKKQLVNDFIRYTSYHLVVKKFDLKGLYLFLKAFYHGIRSDFSHHLEYIGK